MVQLCELARANPRTATLLLALVCIGIGIVIGYLVWHSPCNKDLFIDGRTYYGKDLSYGMIANPRTVHLYGKRFGSYDMVKDLDSPGGDLVKSPVSKDMNVLSDECIANKNCVGFNKNGWLKKAIVPSSKLVPAKGSILYVKKPEVKVPTSGFNNYDSPGNDLLYVPQFAGDRNTLARICTAVPECIAFNTSGYMKKKVVAPLAYTKGTTLYRLGD